MGGSLTFSTATLGRIFVASSWSIALALLPASHALAGTGTFGSHAGFNANGGGNSYLGATHAGSNQLAGLHGHDFGTFSSGDSLLLSGGDLLTWKNEGGDVTGAFIGYNVHEASSSSGTFSEISLGWSNNAPFTNAAGSSFSNYGDQKWAQIASTPDLLSGLAPGDYKLEVYFKATSSEGDRYDSRNGENHVASFAISAPIPEPATFMLGLLGMLTVVAMGRRCR
jgi:hypothetical protein